MTYLGMAAEMYNSDSSDALSDTLGTETLDVRYKMPDHYLKALTPNPTNHGYG